MTIEEFLTKPDMPGQVRSLIGGRMYRRPERARNVKAQATLERLLELFVDPAGLSLRTDFLIRHEPQDLFRVELTVLSEHDGSIPLVIHIPRPSETYGESNGKVDACLAGGVGQVWELEFYLDQVRVLSRDEKPMLVCGNDPLPRIDGLPVITPTQIYRDLAQDESALPPDIPKLWVDVLREKHEYFSVKDTERLEVKVDDRLVQLVVPDHFAESTVLFATERDGLLTAIGCTSELFDDRPVGVIMIAKSDDSGVYLVHVWHELYPHSLENLGLCPT